MGRSHSNAWWLVLAILCLWSVGGCGKSSKSGTALFPARVNLNPGANLSLSVGGVQVFTASAQTGSGTTINVPITYTSSDTSVLTIAPNGVACAGHFDVAFTTCTGGGTGIALVTASALGSNSIPTWVFVHPPIDNITVTGTTLNGAPIIEPCLSQTQSMVVEAHAFSQGTDITASVGPFAFSANNLTVVNLVPIESVLYSPITNAPYSLATNQATAIALFPGITQIYASAGGVSSSSFQQPIYQNAQGTTAPVLDFFSTCPIKTVSISIGSGSQVSNQTTFVTAKGATEPVTAVLTDVMGYTSLPSTSDGIVLSKIPLTWSSSQPGVLAASTGCLETCTLATPLSGSGSVTASCSPPTCNVGFPYVPPSLSGSASDPSSPLSQCNAFFATQTFSCQQLIPVPVYAETAISGLITGATVSPTVLATSTGCAPVPPVTCSTSVYNVSTSKAVAGNQFPLPVPPNSLLFDLAGDKAILGSQFGAQVINPSNFGTNSSPYTALGTVTGTLLGISNNGGIAVFSDTAQSVNQTYVVNLSNINSPSLTPLNISDPVATTFSPDGLNSFIFGNGGSSMYVYSTVQGLQGPIALSGPVNLNTVAFSPNGAFAFVAEAAANGNPANLTAFNNCDNQVSTSPAIPGPPIPAVLTLPHDPLLMQVLPGVHIEGTDSYGFQIPDGVHVLVLDSTGLDVITAITSAAPSGTICPQTLTFVSNDPVHPAQRIELGQSTLQPVNFFVSADASHIYIAAASNASILVYDFGAGAVASGIELAGNATPISAQMSVDTGTIVVGGSDGMMHILTTSLGGSDQFQVAFPSLPNYLNPFCTATPTPGPCALSLLAVRP
jgi:hypothetical protein